MKGQLKGMLFTIFNTLKTLFKYREITQIKQIENKNKEIQQLNNDNLKLRGSKILPS
jgi:hypothetical protein